MSLWDQFTQQGPLQQTSPQDRSSLWGWLTSLFSGQQPRSITNPFNRWDPVQAAAANPPAATAATPPLQPEVSWNANPWANMSGVPASMQVAPPSMFTASSPQRQAQWQRASNPAGYMGMGLPQVPQAPQAAPLAATPSVLRPPPAAMMPPPPKPMPPPVITGPSSGPLPLAWMPPAGGSQGWAGVQGLPGTQSDVRTAPFRNLRDTDVVPSLVAPSTTASGIPLTDTKSRNLSDAELEKMSNVDIARAAARTDLTYGDRMAILARLGR